jgi:hypothetical protein
MMKRRADVSECGEPRQHVGEVEAVRRQRNRLHRLLGVVRQLLDVLAVDQIDHFGLMRKHRNPPRFGLRVGRDVLKTATTGGIIQLRQVENAPSVALLTYRGLRAMIEP